MFDILYMDDHFVAINKPPGIMVHRSPITTDKTFILQLLRNQIGRHLYPVHRLDRATAGVLIFGIEAQAAKDLAVLLRDQDIEKTYLAIVRGWVQEEERIDYALRRDFEGPYQEAITEYRRLATAELDIPVDRYPQSRYSFVMVHPVTGRQQQIRRHFKHIRHPIIGDKKRGDRHHNRMFRRVFDTTSMMLLARRLGFVHPVTGEHVAIVAPPHPDMDRLLQHFGWSLPD